MNQVILNHSSALSHGIRVEVESFYVQERSDPSNDIYFFAYRIVIHNQGEAPARLISRHWIITDSLGRVEEVRGDGVVGEQPRIEPNGQFEYTSFCPLNTQTGSMRGTYRMVRDDGTDFEADIAEFRLLVPHALN